MNLFSEQIPEVDMALLPLIFDLALFGLGPSGMPWEMPVEATSWLKNYTNI